MYAKSSTERRKSLVLGQKLHGKNLESLETAQLLDLVSPDLSDRALLPTLDDNSIPSASIQSIV